MTQPLELRFGDQTEPGNLVNLAGDERVFQRLAETFKALGDPLRLKILYVLSRTEVCVGDLSRLLGARESNVSQQLRLLRTMHLVKYRRDGKLAFYSLDDEHIEHLFRNGLAHVREKATVSESATR